MDGKLFQEPARHFLGHTTGSWRAPNGPSNLGLIDLGYELQRLGYGTADQDQWRQMLGDSQRVKLLLYVWARRSAYCNLGPTAVPGRQRLPNASVTTSLPGNLTQTKPLVSQHLQLEGYWRAGLGGQRRVEQSTTFGRNRLGVSSHSAVVLNGSLATVGLVGAGCGLDCLG